MYDVLLADNDPQSLGLLETAIKCIPEASVVAKVTNGGEVLALLTGMKPDIAIVDAELTTRGGQKIVQALRAATGKTVFIFVSSSEKHAVEAFEKEAVDYLIKPVSFERLRNLSGAPNEGYSPRHRTSALPNSSSNCRRKRPPRTTAITVSYGCAIAAA